jgi:anti-sigma factor RsiW
MAADRPHSGIDEAELARLADGTLPEERHAAVERALAQDPELRERLTEQQRMVAAVHAAAGSVEAPARLHARVRSQHEGRGRRTPVARRRYALALAGAVAVVVGVLVALPSGTPGGPSLVQAAALGARPPVAPAPPRYDHSQVLLAERAAGIPFPNWAPAFGWHAAGVRHDRVHGRDVTTVYYTRGGSRIAYSIVAGKSLDVPGSAARTTIRGVDIASLRAHGRTVITWEREGHTCVLSGKGVSPSMLAPLAAWRAQGELPY